MSSAVTSESTSGHRVLGPGAEVNAQHLYAWTLPDLREGFAKLLGAGGESHSERATQISNPNPILAIPGSVQPSDTHTAKLPLVS